VDFEQAATFCNPWFSTLVSSQVWGFGLVGREDVLYSHVCLNRFDATMFFPAVIYVLPVTQLILTSLNKLFTKGLFTLRNSVLFSVGVSCTFGNKVIFCNKWALMFSPMRILLTLVQKVEVLSIGTWIHRK